MWKRYIIEFGWGADLHGQDVTKAAKKAVKDAISKICLSGLKEIIGIEDLNEGVRLEIMIASPDPEQVDQEEVLSVIPFGKTDLKVKEGGMRVPGIFVREFDDQDDSIVICNAAITVYVDVRTNSV